MLSLATISNPDSNTRRTSCVHTPFHLNLSHIKSLHLTDTHTHTQNSPNRRGPHAAHEQMKSTILCEFVCVLPKANHHQRAHVPVYVHMCARVCVYVCLSVDVHAQRRWSCAQRYHDLKVRQGVMTDNLYGFGNSHTYKNTQKPIRFNPCVCVSVFIQFVLINIEMYSYCTMSLRPKRNTIK